MELEISKRECKLKKIEEKAIKLFDELDELLSQNDKKDNKFYKKAENIIELIRKNECTETLLKNFMLFIDRAYINNLLKSNLNDTKSNPEIKNIDEEIDVQNKNSNKKLILLKHKLKNAKSEEEIVSINKQIDNELILSKKIIDALIRHKEIYIQ